MVIHFGMTKSVEGYYQQTGRAGRDGLPAKCVLLFSRQDVVRCFNISASSLAAAAALEPVNAYTGSGNNNNSSSSSRGGSAAALTAEEMAQYSASERLSHQINCMKEYSTTCGRFHCRRKYLMHYFGESMDSLEATNIPAPGGSGQRYFASRNCCDLCDEVLRRHESSAAATANLHAHDSAVGDNNSLVDPMAMDFHQEGAELDISKEVHMLLCTVIGCGERFGIAVPLAVLAGKHDKSVQRVHEYSALPHFGAGTLHGAEWWKELVHQLTDVDHYIEAMLTKMAGSAFSYQRYVVTEAGRKFLSGGAPRNAWDRSSPAFDRAVHVYRTPLTRELRKLAHIEQNIRRPPPAQLAPRSPPLRSRSTGSSDLPGQATSSNAVFRFVPDEMAFDPAAVALLGATPKEHAAQTRVRLMKELSTQLERQLRQTRNDIAQRSGLNPYNVLTTADIAQLVQAAPETLAALGALSGWGDWKLRNFGQAFVDAVVRFKSEHASEYRDLRVAEEMVAAPTMAPAVTGSARGANTLLNAGFESQAAGGTESETALAVPVRPSVRLYRPNYEAASRSIPAVLDASTEVARLVTSAPTGGEPPNEVAGCEPTNTTASSDAVEGVSTSVAIPAGAGYVGTGTDDERDDAGTSESQEGALPVLHAEVDLPPGGEANGPPQQPSASSSAFAVAARKRQLAHTGLAGNLAEISYLAQWNNNTPYSRYSVQGEERS
jgi:superfamily II DNA helicase RecQ